jgi:hypothetical protein
MKREDEAARGAGGCVTTTCGVSGGVRVARGLATVFEVPATEEG